MRFYFIRKQNRCKMFITFYYLAFGSQPEKGKNRNSFYRKGTGPICVLGIGLKLACNSG